MRFTQINLAAILMLIALSASTQQATEPVIELLVSRSNTFSATVDRFDAVTGQYRGILGDLSVSLDFDQAKGLAVDSAGRAYTAVRCTNCQDTITSQVLRFALDKGGYRIDPAGSPPYIASDGAERGFEGLAIASDFSEVVTSQSETGLIESFNIETGAPLDQPFSLSSPRGLAPLGFGSVYALSQVPQLEGNGQILRRPGSGDPFETFVASGGFLSLDDGSAGLTFGPDREVLYVVDTVRERVLRYGATSGDFLGEFATPSGDGCLDPVGLAFGPHDDNLYVSCNTSDSVVRYDGQTGEFLGEFVSVFSPTYLAFASYDLPSSLRLISPLNGAQTKPVDIFRWNPSEHSDFFSYRVTIATDANMENVFLQVPAADEPEITVPYVPIDLSRTLELTEFENYHWRVKALDASGNVVEESQEVRSFYFEIDGRGFTVIGGLIQSNQIAALLVGATITVNSSRFFVDGTFVDDSAETFDDGSYAVSATTRNDGETNERIEVLATSDGFASKSVVLSDSQKVEQNLALDFSLKPLSSHDFDISGAVESKEGNGLCAMVLASGQFMFSCNPDGPYSLIDLPRDNDGTVKRQIYVDGYFPKIDVLSNSVSETVIMDVVGSCPNYNTPYNPGVFPESAGKRIDISGSVLLQDTNTPICALVLANGQFMFSCDSSGNYALNIPLDSNGQFKLQVYADGFVPSIQRFDEFQAVNDVRMARAGECQ